MHPRLALLLTTVLIATLVALPATAQEDEPVFEERTETLFISAGCPQDTPGTCTSTRWLGREPGDAGSNYITAITPVDEVLYRVDGSVNWRDYPSDKTLRADGYRLQAGDVITAVVVMTSRGPGVNTTVHGRMAMRQAGVVRSTVLEADEQTVLLTAPASDTEVTLEFEVPEELDGKTVSAMTFEVGIHGVHAAAGYIDQRGGSTVTIPHHVEIS